MLSGLTRAFTFTYGPICPLSCDCMSALSITKPAGNLPPKTTCRTPSKKKRQAVKNKPTSPPDPFQSTINCNKNSHNTQLWHNMLLQEAGSLVILHCLPQENTLALNRIAPRPQLQPSVALTHHLQPTRRGGEGANLWGTLAQLTPTGLKL